MKCDECGGEVKPKDCELANLSRVIDGKEYSFCCFHCSKEHEDKE